MLPIETFQSQEVSTVMTYPSPLRPSGGVKCWPVFKQEHPRMNVSSPILPISIPRLNRAKPNQTWCMGHNLELPFRYGYVPDVALIMGKVNARSQFNLSEYYSSQFNCYGSAFPIATELRSYADPRTFGNFLWQFPFPNFYLVRL